MQSPETDRIKTEWGWINYCVQCGEAFESKRSDAAYCCSNHRVKAKREEEKLKQWIAGLEDQAREIERYATKYKRSKMIFEAMSKYQKQITSTLSIFEE